MLTVLLATHNGSKTLERSLQSFTDLQRPENGHIFVIVDNASTDNTARIVDSFKDKLPLMYLRTERQGKNIALNEGLKYVKGDLVVLTDDDTLPTRDWLVHHRKMADDYPNISIWGGSIEPVWPKPPEPWILEQVPQGAVFALTDPKQSTGPIAADMVWGPNMAVRTAVFEAGHRFNENIGPAAGQYTMGSEVEFTCRLELAGYKSWFLKEARVGHQIRPNQLERGWILDRAYRFGKLKYFQKASNTGSRPNFARAVPRWRYGAVLYNGIRSVFYLVAGNKAARFKADWDRHVQLGYIYAAWEAARGD